jgi:hypothetical protein
LAALSRREWNFSASEDVRISAGTSIEAVVILLALGLLPALPLPAVAFPRPLRLEAISELRVASQSVLQFLM